MSISGQLIKELRDKTQAGMMECKRALEEAGGDLEKAIELLRTSGKAKAVSKSQRTAAEGTIVALAAPDNRSGLVIEVNCETDFVAKEVRFQEFAKRVARKALDEGIHSLESLQQKFDHERTDLVSTLGENISIRRLAWDALPEGATGAVGVYGHGDSRGTRIGTLVVVQGSGGSVELARTLAMQVAAMRPEFVKPGDIPADRLEKEREIFTQQTKEEGRPEAMIAKITDGKLKKWANEICLVGQAFVKDPQITVEALLKTSQAEVQSFIRFEVGEGIEKKVTDFRAEVMAQVKGN